MDDTGMGRLFRALRLRLGWRQLDVFRRADISRTVYSEIERGHLNGISLGTMRKVANVLEVRIGIEPTWRGKRIERVISGRHAALAERLTATLVAAGWEVRPEASFNSYGERGVVDLVAWHSTTRTMLLIEIKTELVGPSDLLATTDRRRRLAGVIAQDRGWNPLAVAQWVVLAAGRTNQRRVAEHHALLRAAFPADGRSAPSWVANPRGRLDALWFLPDDADRSTGRAARGPNRVPTRRSMSNQA
jgi:transcriptional regulator with XRE-family HTH domain